MNFQHQSLANGRWEKLSFLEQVANIGSEVERSIAWREKSNEEYAIQAFYRSLELFDLTLSANHSYSQRREIARAREMWVDFFAYNNTYSSSAQGWRNYFLQLLFALKNKVAFAT